MTEGIQVVDVELPIGFLALWENKPSEYHASSEEERGVTAAIQNAFTRARSQGVRMFGRYGCRWSTARQYFTFWLSPSLAALEDAMDDLERAGDFRFADSEHLIGTPIVDADMTDEDFLRRDGPDLRCPLAFAALWRRTDGWFRATAGERNSSDRAVRQVFATARHLGIQMLGRYDCRWSTQWDFFTFWLVPRLEILERTIDELERAGDFRFANSRHMIGILEPRFRFGRHLQGGPD